MHFYLFLSHSQWVTPAQHAQISLLINTDSREKIIVFDKGFENISDFFCKLFMTCVYLMRVYICTANTFSKCPSPTVFEIDELKMVVPNRKHVKVSQSLLSVVLMVWYMTTSVSLSWWIAGKKYACTHINKPSQSQMKNMSLWIFNVMIEKVTNHDCLWI